MKTITIDTITKKATEVNTFALKNTEKSILKSIEVAERFQQKTENGIQKSLHFSEKQQDRLFTFLENIKAKISKKSA